VFSDRSNPEEVAGSLSNEESGSPVEHRLLATKSSGTLFSALSSLINKPGLCFGTHHFWALFKQQQNIKKGITHDTLLRSTVARQHFCLEILPRLKIPSTYFSFNSTGGESCTKFRRKPINGEHPPPAIEDSNLIVRGLLQEMEIECAKCAVCALADVLTLDVNSITSLVVKLNQLNTNIIA
jgi:hypothetical protein